MALKKKREIYLIQKVKTVTVIFHRENIIFLTETFMVFFVTQVKIDQKQVKESSLRLRVACIIMVMENLQHT